MPIRSPRGRTAAYRALWQWPLRSPTRLVGTVVAVLALVAAASLAVTASGGSPGGLLGTRRPVGADRTPSVAVPPTATALAPLPDLEPTTLPLSAAPPAALDVARRWSRAWVRPARTTTTAAWLDGLKGTTTDEYLGVLGAVDPTNIRATRVTGAPKPVRVAARSVQVQVPTDAFTLLVLVVDTEDGWRVAGYDRT